MSSQDKSSHIIVANDDASLFAGSGSPQSSPRPVTKPSPEPSAPGSESSEAPSRSVREKPVKPVATVSEEVPECIRPLVASRERIAGLTVWDNRIVVSVVAYQHGQVVLRRAAELRFPEDSEDSQRIRLLRKWWRNEKFGTRSVWVGVDSEDIVQKYFSLPLAEEGLGDALGMLAEDSLQEDASQMLFDYFLFEKKKPADPCTGMMYACSKGTLLRHKYMLERAGLLVCGFGVPGIELAKTFRWIGPPPEDRFADCVLLLTETTADILILFGESSVYTRRIATVASTWGDHLEYLVQSLNDAIMYFQLYLASDMSVGRIHLAGVMPGSVDMVEFLLRETGLVVQMWVPMMQVSKKVKRPVSDLIVSSLGLALRRD